MLHAAGPTLAPPDFRIPTPSRERIQTLDRLMVQAVADLHGSPTPVEQLAASGRMMALSLVLAAGAILYWILPASGWGLIALIIAGLAYALLLIASHEMVHGTLFGVPPLEFGLGCLLSWPMAWPFATYARLHRLHHRWNGLDARDPERTQALPQDHLFANPFGRWLHHHPFAVRCLVLGGVGLILDTARKGWQLRSVDPRLKAAQRLDGVGVSLFHGGMLALAFSQGVMLRYLLFWIILERVIGVVVQYRGLVEHHGLWEKAQEAGGVSILPQRLRQLATSRDVATGPWLNAWMGGLPHHSAHHAFPAVPSARLPEASARIIALLRSEHWALPSRLESYGEAPESCTAPTATMGVASPHGTR
jgi:fatty acid desaturase